MYSLLQHSQITWEIRYQYFGLVKSYYQNEITLYDFKKNLWNDMFRLMNV
jgi:hypothetical protein